MRKRRLEGIRTDHLNRSRWVHRGRIGFPGGVLPAEGGHAVTRIASVDEGRYVDGRWTPGRRINGDETNGGTALIFSRGQVLIQRIRVYRHE